MYCDACWTVDPNWLELFCVDRSETELTLFEPLSLPPLPMLKMPRLIPPPLLELALCVWLLSTCCSLLESSDVCCEWTAETNCEKVVWTE